MSIRKHGAATGEITGVENKGPLVKEASAKEWDGTDEEALAGESADDSE